MDKTPRGCMALPVLQLEHGKRLATTARECHPTCVHIRSQHEWLRHASLVVNLDQLIEVARFQGADRRLHLDKSETFAKPLSLGFSWRSRPRGLQ